MSKFINPEEQKQARERLRVIGNKSALQGVKKAPTTPPIPRAKMFNVNEWKAIVDRMGRIGAVSGKLAEAGTIEEAKGLHDLMAHELTWLGRELAGGSK